MELAHPATVLTVARGAVHPPAAETTAARAKAHPEKDRAVAGAAVAMVAETATVAVTDATTRD
jgi:DeoR/GlpR family transcriptional regulator of sugar metabolism